MILAAYVDESKGVQKENRGALRQILYGFSEYVRDNAVTIAKEQYSDPSGSFGQRLGKVIDLLNRTRNPGIAKNITDGLEKASMRLDKNPDLSENSIRPAHLSEKDVQAIQDAASKIPIE